MTLTEIIKASNVDPGITVECDASFATVCISDDECVQEDIFMQGDQASEFIENCRRLYDEAGDVTMTEVEIHCAMPYAENLWN